MTSKHTTGDMKVKDWKAFQEYRRKQYVKMFASKEYRKIQEELNAGLASRVVKHKFLWWKWRTKEEPFLYMKMAYMRNSIEQEKDLTALYVPEDTVENCLHWLAGYKWR